MQTNVLHLIPSFHQGGSEQQAVQLVKLLKNEAKYRMFVGTLEKSGVLLSEIEAAGFTDIPEFRLDSFYDANMMRQLAKCRRFIRDNGVEIVQTHDFYTNIFGMAAAALARVTVRIAGKRETGMRTPRQMFIERRAFGLADSVVANSERVKEFLAGAGVKSDKVSVIYNAIDVEKMSRPGNKDKICEALRLPCERRIKFVTIVANLRSPVKNHRMFIRSAAKVKDAVPNAKFIIAGEGELTGEIKDFAHDLGLASDTFFVGRCADIAGLLAVSEVGCLTSDSEGFSNSILEYMAAGKPVVATAVGGAAEAVSEGETGYLVDPNDDKTFAERVIELLNDSAKAMEMGAKGKAAAQKNFSLAARTARTLQLYDALMDRAVKGDSRAGI